MDDELAEILKKYCFNALGTLAAQFNASAALTHGSSLGSVREHLIRDFLMRHLPEMVRLVSGQIFDSKDARSGQQDVILVLNSMPRLPFAGGIDLVYAEGVVATIEIKSTLDARTVKAVGESIKGVRSLSHTIGATTRVGVNHSWPANQILTVLLTYDGMALPTLEHILDHMDDTACPDLLVDLSKGLLVRNHGLVLPKSSDKKYVTISDPPSGFMLFLTVLTEITATLASRGVNWRSYFPTNL